MYKDAFNSAPKKCTCGKGLIKPKYGTVNVPTGYKEKLWYIECAHCCSTYIWSWPNVWKERSALPLFDTKTVVA